MIRTYGTLSLAGDKWVYDGVPPHVAIRLKQLFPRIPKHRTSPFEFPNDKAHSADLAWFIQRYPVTISLNDSVTLDGGRQQFEQDAAAMEAILKPDYQPKQLIGLRDGEHVRPYQSQAIELTLLRHALLLGDDVGLGKTYTTAGLFLNGVTLPAAVVMQVHLQQQWQDKIESFTHLTCHKIKGTKPYNLPPADVYLFRYSQIAGWIDTFADGFFKAVAFDEIQELRTGTKSAKGEAAKELADNAVYRLGLSATPIYNYGVETWNIMQMLDDQALGSFDEFLREWCVDRRQVKDPQALGSFLREQNLMLRRTKREVGQQLPPINTIIEHVDADQQTLKDVEQLARELAIKTTTGSFVERGQAGRELDLMLRQATGVSKAKGVAAYVQIVLESDVPVLLMGWHRDVYDIWLKALAAYRPAMYTGSESENQKNESVRRFVEGETNLFIMSLRSGAGLDGLQHRCSTVIFGELDWSPKVHEQIIGRLDREGQQEQITCVYLNTDEGSDPPMVELLGLKQSQATGIIDPGKEFETRYSDKSRIQALAERFLSKKTSKEAA
ncbi:DEAD/DEAH box helicase [Shewanella sp. C32]|uniref:DEAD/DEAH box helicase n=1 Tax=Shewanella electrica TaxID=515560 RepID=A0ABT2FQA4_9GAMM|nr:DEAD/DEAH box helicase [Shewanella electrica]MCH1926910.1 DEAD/DEAH box helicase [Shewanella electrica]MCS4558500.1 DEAD/DEAH box helicase [Shewanella electrica]